jgi:hypothetical protein
MIMSHLDLVALDK